MDLTPKQRSYLRGLAHKLRPAVQMGKGGLTAALIKEVDRNLKDHELIKVRLGYDERSEFLAATDEIATATEAAVVQTVGRIVVLYREGDEPEIQLPKTGAATTAR